MDKEAVLQGILSHLKEIREQLDSVHSQLIGICDLAAREVAISLDTIEEAMMEIEEALGIDS